MSLDDNPYAAPLSVSVPATTSADFRDVFVGWERLRVVYNSVLVALTLFCGIGSVGVSKFWFTAMFGTVVTNVCFCVGPVLEGYATWYSGRPVRWLRWGLFLVGQSIAATLACTVILNAFPGTAVFGF